MSGVRLRPVVEEDVDLVFTWRNDPFIVALGSLQQTVTFDEHRAWFRQSLLDRNRLLFIIEAADENVGLVRFDRESESTATISAYLLERFTGKGYGPPAIREGCNRAMQIWTIEKVIACVREENRASQSGFRKAGFEREETLAACPSNHVCLSYNGNRRARVE